MSPQLLVGNPILTASAGVLLSSIVDVLIQPRVVVYLCDDLGYYVALKFGQWLLLDTQLFNIADVLELKPHRQNQLTYSVTYLI